MCGEALVSLPVRVSCSYSATPFLTLASHPVTVVCSLASRPCVRPSQMARKLYQLKSLSLPGQTRPLSFYFIRQQRCRHPHHHDLGVEAATTRRLFVSVSAITAATAAQYSSNFRVFFFSGGFDLVWKLHIQDSKPFVHRPSPILEIGNDPY